MGNKKKMFNGQEFEILDHDEVPGFRAAFYVIISIAVGYLVGIFIHSGGGTH